MQPHAATVDLQMDWEVVIDQKGEKGEGFSATPGVSRVSWRPDDLRKEEIETILKYFALNTQGELREQFSEQIRASLHSHAVRVGKIANRVFLEDGKLTIDRLPRTRSAARRTPAACGSAPGRSAT